MKDQICWFRIELQYSVTCCKNLRCKQVIKRYLNMMRYIDS